MNRLEIILSAMLVLSIVLNIGLIAYARAVVIRILSISEELYDLQRMVGTFTNHLQAVYELDSFYGDETLRGLLEHAISFNDQMDTFDYIISLTEADTPTTEEGPDDDTPQEEETRPA
tara:strand:- start:208 stop:561 length:354 start_codon:yes stop_codon:yes gene_type:complete